MAIGSLALLVLLIVVYYPVLSWLVNTWWDVTDYNYGFLVPVFSAYLLWDRRDMLKLDQLKGSYWAVPVLLLAIAVSVFANYRFNLVLMSWTIVPMVGGLVLLVGGWHALLWAWPSVAFLFFMSPLPQDFAGILGEQLQLVGTSVSVIALQTLGMAAIADGTVIQLSHSRLGVEEACSGLRMLMLFFAACVGAAFYLRTRTPLIRILIAISAPPIAVISNVARITVTAVLYENVSQELGDKVFHNLAGWFMMPIAIGLVWLEMAVLDRLFVAPQREGVVVLGAGFAVPRQAVEDRARLPESARPDKKQE